MVLVDEVEDMDLKYCSLIISFKYLVVGGGADQGVEISMGSQWITRYNIYLDLL